MRRLPLHQANTGKSDHNAETLFLTTIVMTRVEAPSVQVADTATHLRVIQATGLPVSILMATLPVSIKRRKA